MRALLILAALVVATVSAQNGPWCATDPNSPLYTPGAYSASNQICGNAATNGIPCDMATMVSASNNPTYMNYYRQCSPTGPAPMSRCCVDECYIRSTASCTAHGTGQLCMYAQGAGNTKMCMVREKVCRLMVNATQCNMYSFCKYNSGECNFAEPTIPEGAAGDSVKDACPALHPVVVAMLALMFITFVGAVVLVAVVVYRNQVKFDEEEERRSQIEAAAAEAKRSRKANRNTL